MDRPSLRLTRCKKFRHPDPSGFEKDSFLFNGLRVLVAARRCKGFRQLTELRPDCGVGKPPVTAEAPRLQDVKNSDTVFPATAPPWDGARRSDKVAAVAFERNPWVAIRQGPNANWRSSSSRSLVAPSGKPLTASMPRRRWAIASILA